MKNPTDLINPKGIIMDRTMSNLIAMKNKPRNTSQINTIWSIRTNTMKKILAIVVALSGLLEGMSQELETKHILKGRIISDSEQMMYATVGIIGANVGTISNHDGFFELEIPSALLKEELTISHIGFQSLSLSLDSLIGLDKIEILLNDKLQYLDEVTISSEKLKGKTKDYGNIKKHNLFLWIQNEEVGSEIATLIEPKHEFHLNSVSVNINNESGQEFSVLLNLYSLDAQTKLPAEQLLREQKVITSDLKKGWLDIDLREENLVLPESFFVSFQWLDVDQPIPIGGRANNARNSLIRYKALGTWKKFYDWDIKANGTWYKNH